MHLFHVVGGSSLGAMVIEVAEHMIFQVFNLIPILVLSSRNKCIATRSKCLASSNKKLLVTSALLAVTRSY